MKKHQLLIVGLVSLLSLIGCGNKASNNNESSSNSNQSTEEGPKKSVEITSISLGNSNNKAYITVSGKQTNYEDNEFKWAWGLLGDDGKFADGKEKPSAEDFKAVTVSAANTFTVKYCLTDITSLKAGTLYRVYGGTPESYDDIPFQSNNFGAQDETRKYYLRSDQSNSLVFDNIQPIKFTKASVVKVEANELPTGVTQAGAYLKFGGANEKNLTMETINSWHQNEKIAGNFQRVIGDSYFIHDHVDEERFWKIEGNDVFFYCYVGFLVAGEGWMTHFDLVSGNAGANLQMDATFAGETPYVIDGATYKVYADKNKGGEENYWGCLGVYREAE